MTPLTPETVPARDPGVVSQAVANEIVLVLPEAGKAKVINETGAAIWELLDGQRNIRQIAQAISEQFDVEPQTAEADTIRFLTELTAHGLVIG